MNLRLHHITLLALCITTWSPSLASAASPECDGVVRGRVVERFDGVDDAFGLFEASVELRDGDAEPRRIETGLEGNFAFGRVCEARVRLTVRFDGYATATAQATAGEDVEITLAVADDGTGEPWQTVTTRTDEELRDARTRVTLEEEDLDETRGESLAQSLKKISGVRAIETGTVSKPVLQGMHSNRVVILFDGLRHESLSWGLDHAPEIDPFAAARLSVVKGAAGVRYGPDAIGGVILVEPHQLPHRDATVRGDVHAVGLSNGLQGIGAAVLRGGVPGVEGLGWRVQGSGKMAGALSTPDYVLDNTGARELNVSAAVGVRRATWGLELSGSRFDARNGVFSGVVSENTTQFEDAISRDVPRGVERFVFDYDLERPRQEVTHTVAKLHGHLDVAQAGRLEATGAIQLNERAEYDIARRSVTGPQLDFALNTGSLDVSWMADLGERWSWSVGAVGALQTHVYSGRRFVPNYRSSSGGAFAWLKRKGDAVDLEVGARADVEEMSTFQREAIGGSDAPIVRTDLTYLTPSAVAGARWRAAEEIEVSLNLSSASRAPTIDELFVDGVSQGVASFLVGDSDLDPERTWAANGNLEVATSWFVARLSPYAQYIDGYIYAAPRLSADGTPEVRLTVGGGFPTFSYRQVDAFFAGVDADVRAQPFTWLALDTRASMVRARDLTRDDFLVFIPPDEIAQAVTLEAASLGPFTDLSLGAEVAYTAEQTRVDLGADFTAPPPGYLLAHAQAAAGLPMGERSLRASLEVKNLANQRYRSYLSRQRYFADEPGRSVNLRLKYSF